MQAALEVSAAGPFEVCMRIGEAAIDAAEFDAVLLARSTGFSDLPAHATATAPVVVTVGEAAALGSPGTELEFAL